MQCCSPDSSWQTAIVASKAYFMSDKSLPTIPDWAFSAKFSDSHGHGNKKMALKSFVSVRQRSFNSDVAYLSSPGKARREEFLGGTLDFGLSAWDYTIHRHV